MNVNVYSMLENEKLQNYEILSLSLSLSLSSIILVVLIHPLNLDSFSLGRHRHVVYADTKDWDASTVPPEWHAWLHHMSDDVPTVVKPVKPVYKMDHIPMRPSHYGSDANYNPPGHWSRGQKYVFVCMCVCVCLYVCVCVCVCMYV